MSNPSRKKALITGITGQDGSYLAEFLLEKGYEVHGIKRRGSSFNTGRIDHIFEGPEFVSKNFFIDYGDMTDSTNLIRFVQRVQPDEIYNLAAQSHVYVSFIKPEYTANADAVGTLRLLEAIRILGMEDKVKFYQASTSEMFGASPPPQNEDTPFYPRSPYGVAKLYAHWITKNYRESYGMFAVSGIQFNHESPRRGETFVTRKITRAATRIKLGLEDKLYLGNLDSKRDWGHSKDYVRAMYMMLQADEPDDYVVATGKQRTVREFCEGAFEKVGIDIEWKGEGVNERGIDKKTDKVIVEVLSRYFRPAEVDSLQGDATKIRETLGWKPEISFDELVKEMIAHDLEEAKREAHLKEGGFRTRKQQDD